jgi:integrase
MATTEHKEGKATVKVIYWHWKTAADGSHPFILQITKDRKSKRIATGLSLHPKYWNADKKEVRRSYPEPQRDTLIKDLEKWRKKYAEAAETLATNDEQHDAPAVAAKAIESRKAQRRIKLLAYVEELAAGMAKVGKIGNAGVYRDLGNQLAKFVGSEYSAPEPPLGKGQESEKAAWVQKYDVPFERTNVAFCNEWEATLRATGVEEITLSLRFRTLRAVLNRAVAAGLMKAEHYPFARNVAERHKFSVGKFDVKTAKRAISRSELRKLEALEPTTDRHRLAKDAFLFSFYCGGINWVDMAQLRWSNLGVSDVSQQPQRLTYTRQKTKGNFAMALLEPAAAIAATYRPFTYSDKNSYVFPVLDPARHISPTQIKNRLHKVLGQVNEDLKTLGELAGIATPLTTYVARHSFATALKNTGTSTALISQMMGHSSEAVTSIYLDSFASELADNALNTLL